MAQELGINIGEQQGTVRYVRYDRGIKSAVKQRVRSVNYGGTYEERVPDGINIIEETYTASFSNRSYSEISDLIDFFDYKNGVESFLLYVKDTSNTQGARGVPVICQKYNVTYVNKKVATLACTFQKVVTTEYDDDEIYQDLTQFSQGQYTLLSNKAEAVAGESITFTLLTLNVPDGSYVAFDITGVTEYTVEGDYTDFVVVDNRGEITVTLDDPFTTTVLPAVLTFTLTDFSSASIDIDIFDIAITAPTLTFATQSPTNQSVVFHLKSDGTYGLSDSLLGDYIYNEGGSWINNKLGLDSSEYEVYFESTIDDPSITVVSDPVGAISQYVDFNQDITVTFTSSLADNVGPNSEAFNLTIREKADTLNNDTGVITAQLEGASVPVPTYALSLRNIIEGTSNSLYENETAVLDFTSNQPDTSFTWDIVSGTAALSDYNINLTSGTFTTNESGNAVITGPTLRDDSDIVDESFTLYVAQSGSTVASQVITIAPLPEQTVPSPTPEKDYYVDFVFTNYNPVTTIPGTSTSPYVSNFEEGDAIYPYRQELAANAALALEYKDIPAGTQLKIGLRANNDDSVLSTIFGGSCPTYDSPATILVGSERNEQVFYFNGTTNPYYLSVLNAPSTDQTINVKIWDPLNLEAQKVKSIIITQVPAVPTVTGTFLPGLSSSSFGTATLNEEISLGFQVLIRNPANEVGYKVDVQRYENNKMTGNTTLARTLSDATRDWFIEFNNTTGIPASYTPATSISVAAGAKSDLSIVRKFVYRFENSAVGTDTLDGTIKLYHTSDLATPQASMSTTMTGTSTGLARVPATANLVFNLAADEDYENLILKIWFQDNGYLMASVLQQEGTLEGFPQYDSKAFINSVKWDSAAPPEQLFTTSIDSVSNAFRVVSKTDNVPNITRNKSAANAPLISKTVVSGAGSYYQPSNLTNQLEYTWPLTGSYAGTLTRNIKFSDQLEVDSSVWVPNKISIVVTINIAAPTVISDTSGGKADFGGTFQQS